MTTPLFRSPARSAPRHLSRPFDIVVASIAALGTVGCGGTIAWVFSVASRPDSTGMEFLWFFPAVAGLLFSVPALVCTLIGMTGRRPGMLLAGRLLVAGFLLGGPFLVGFGMLFLVPV